MEAEVYRLRFTDWFSSSAFENERDSGARVNSGFELDVVFFDRERGVARGGHEAVFRSPHAGPGIRLLQLLFAIV